MSSSSPPDTSVSSTTTIGEPSHSQADSSAAAPAPSAPAPPAIRHDWYQSDDRIVITVLYKNAGDANCAVLIEPEHVRMTATNYVLDLDLLHPIAADQSRYRVGAVKVEITLQKLIGVRWASLERPKVVKAEPQGVPSIYKRNWDSLEKQIESNDDYKEGDALNSLFQQIYKSSSEETRRAMNKSFSESGGTVLSTNWNEIGAAKTEVKPPDGTEFKAWQ